MRRRGIVRLSPELLFELLRLKDATLLDAKVDHFGAGSLDILISSPNMPECQEGAYPLIVSLEEAK